MACFLRKQRNLARSTTKKPSVSAGIMHEHSPAGGTSRPSLATRWRRRRQPCSRHLSSSSNQMTALILVTFASFYAGLLLEGTQAANVAINNRTLEDWRVVDLKGSLTQTPLFINNRYANIPHEEISQWPVNVYYWQAPEAYYQWKIYTYGGDLKFLVGHVVTRGDTSGRYLEEPDLVLEGGSKEHHLKVGYRLPDPGEDTLKGYDRNLTVKMPFTESNWFYLVESEQDGVKHLKLSDTPVTRADFSLVLAGLDRSLIRAKFHGDQVEGSLYDVSMTLANNKSRTSECNNDCSGLLLDDLDDIDLLFDEIRRLAPELKNGPWRRLAWLRGRAKSLNETLSKYLELVALGQEQTQKWASSLDQETLAELLEVKANNLNSRAPDIALEALQTRWLAEKTLNELLKGLWDRIREIIKLLNELGSGPNGLSASKIEKIVRESEMILDELRKRNLKKDLEGAERELRLAKDLLERIRTLLIDPTKSAELLKRLEQLNKVLLDFVRIIEDQVLKPAVQANTLVADGKKRYAALLALLKEAEDRSKESQAALEDARRYLEITKKCLADEAAYLDALPRQITDLNNSIHEIEVKRSILTSVNPDYQKRYVDKCREHGDALMKKAGELDGLFNATRDVADYALRAANAYRDIVTAIDAAEKAAKRAHDAAEKAYKVIVPDDDESLAEKARKAKLKSLELLERAKKLREQDLQRLSLELAKRKQIIDQLFEDIKNLAGELDAINAGLKQLADKNLFERLQEIDAFLKRLFERLAEIHRRLQLLADLIFNRLKPGYEQLAAGSQSSLGNLGQVLEQANKDLAMAVKYASSSKASLEKLLKLEAKLDIDLDLLRRKIMLAHQEATSVHISVSPSSDTGVCVRSYFVPAILSANEGALQVAGGFGLREVSLIWTLHSDEASESLLLFIGSKSDNNGNNDGEFFAIEMYERHIRVVYQLNNYSPAGPHVLQHPRTLDLNDKSLLSDDAWYLIKVQFSDGPGQEPGIRLSVRPVPKAHEPDQQQVHQRLISNGPGKSLAVSPYGEAQVNFYVGGLPPANDFSPPIQLKSSRLTGCLYDMTLNNQQIGLWNFKTNQGCEGCMEGPQEPVKDTAIFSLTGAQSYAMVGQTRNYDRTKYMVSLSLKTSDSNALLFLALSESSGHYLALMLRDGRVVYLVGKLSPTHVNYLSLSSSPGFDYAMHAHLQQNLRISYSSYSSLSSSSSPSGVNQTAASSGGATGAGPPPGQAQLEHTISTEREYNTNQWVKITAEKDQNKLVLAVEDEYREAVADERLLTLDLDQVFFGGVWPMLRPRGRFANASIHLPSVAGCMKDIQIETSPIDLLKRQSYGVEIGCPGSGDAGLERVADTISHLRARARQSQLSYPLPAGR